MASAVSTTHFIDNNLLEMWDHDPGSTSATVVTPDGGTTDRYVAWRVINELVVAAM